MDDVVVKLRRELARSFEPQPARLSWPRLGGCLVAAALLGASWFTALGAHWWGPIDSAVFTAFDAYLRAAGEGSRYFWGLANHRGADIVAMVLFGCLYLHFTFLGRVSTLLHRLSMSCFGVLFAMVSLLASEQIFEPLARQSPTLSVDGAVRLSAAIPDLKFKDASGASFPGDHGIAVITLSAFLWFFGGRRLGWAAVVLSVAFVLPRLVVGAHWASDILVGSIGVTALTLGIALGTPLQAAVVDRACAGLQWAVHRGLRSWRAC